jgi:hypothetical protein
MYSSFRVIIFCLALASPFLGYGQGTGNSPFSQFGIGDMLSQNGSVRNMGMGTAGVSARHHYFVNLQNPALLSNLKTRKKPRPNHTYLYNEFYYNQRVDSTVKIDFGLTYQYRGIHTGAGSENASGANLAYLAFALPLSKTWATSIGLQPFSSVNYDLTYTAPVIGDPNTSATNTTSGRGGTYKLFWGHGVGLTHNLSVGLEAAYIFGNINTHYTSDINTFSTKSYGFRGQEAHNALSIKPGILFRREIVKAYKDTIYEKDTLGEYTIKKLVRKTKSSGAFYNIGLTYDFYSAMQIRKQMDLYIVENTNVIYQDTTIQPAQKYKAQLPPSVRLGFSIDKPMRWTIAADVFYTGWSAYKPSFSSDTMSDSYGFSIGGEFTPGEQLKLRSKTYRLGFAYQKTPITYNGHQLDDISVSIGATVPFGRRASSWSAILPRLNVAVVAGQRGSIAGVGLNEQYIKGYLSIMINEKWFNKRKIY